MWINLVVTHVRPHWMLALVLVVLFLSDVSPAASQAAESASASPAAARIDFNQATEAQLDGLRGVGPATTRRILQARDERPFRDWADLVRRVRGVGHTAAASFSAQGFVVNGAAYVPTSSQALKGVSTPATAAER